MAFTPEDGTGVVGANSLVEIAFADEYFADRGITEWAALSDEQKQSAAILGTTYVCSQYTFKGQRLKSDQGTCFPRVGVVDPAGQPVQGVPDCVKQCTCELSLRASRGPLIPDPVFDENGRNVKMLQEVAGPLKRTIEYAGPGELLYEARFPAVDALMCSWLVKDTSKEFSRGVKMAAAGVNGVSNSEMIAVGNNPDRYTGPMNENGADVGDLDGDSII